jgi:probable HAF family extracellular repeat protein
MGLLESGLKKTLMSGAVAALSLFGAAPATSQQAYLYADGSYTSIAPPGSTQSEAYGINNSGQIVGQYNPGNSQYSAFLYSGGTYTTLSVPGSNGCCTVAFGINDAGQIVGDYSMDNSTYGFLYSNGVYTTLINPLTPYNSTFSGINNSDQIVGQYNSGSATSGFLLSNGTYTPLIVPLSVPAPSPATEPLPSAIPA